MSFTVGFVDQSTPGPSGPITAWAWDFGDGGTSVLENPTHAFATAGNHSVQLTVTGSGSDGTSSTTHVVNVINLGALSSSFTTALSGLSVSFTDTSTAGPSGPITGWAWTFGDGGTSSSQNPSHTYAAGGTYSVALTVTGTAPDGTSAATNPVVSTGTSYRPYIASSTFNKNVPSPAPIHASSSQMISTTDHWLLGGTSYDQYKEWLGPRERVIYFRGDTSGLSTVPVYVNFVSGTGYVCASSPKLNMPMPSFITTILNGGGGAFSKDAIVVIVDSITGDLWEAWKITPPGQSSLNITCSSSRWNAITCNHFSADTISHNGYDAVSAVSESYIHMPAGLLVPEDFADCFTGSDPGTAVNHAIGFFTRTDQNGQGPFPRFVTPARAGIGSEFYGIPYGGRVILDPTINVGTHASVNAKSEPWRSALKKILRGAQQYGLILMDGTGGIGAGGLSAAHRYSVSHGTYNGGSGFVYPWESAGYGWAYSNGIPYDLMSSFKVINWANWTGV